MPIEKAPVVLDLFCGCGGLSLGFSKAGFQVRIGVDKDADSIATFQEAHPRATVFCGEVRNFVAQSRQEYKKPDVIVGGPPCQGFCAINPKRDVNDPRNTCIDQWLDAIAAFSPRFALMENVTGLVSLGDGFALETLDKRLVEMGYDVSVKILQAAHYGAPQSRWRLFLAAGRNGAFEFPFPTHRALISPNVASGRRLTFRLNGENDLFSSFEEPTSVRDAISDLPAIENGGRMDLVEYGCRPQSALQTQLRGRRKRTFNHLVTKLGSLQMQRVRAIREGGMNWTDLPEELVPDNLKRLKAKYGSDLGSKSRFGRLEWGGFFSTILTQPHMYWGTFIHPEQDRVISVRESARAQTVPDSVRVHGSISSQYRQIGNCVPPLMSRAIANEVLNYLSQGTSPK